MNRITKQWVAKAESDFRVASQLIAEKDSEKDAVCFHCQQCAEKYLKALLQHNGAVIPRIHDLHVLVTHLLPFDPSLKRFLSSMRRLTPYGVEYRYPGMTASKQQARTAVRRATEIRREIRARLGLTDKPPTRKKKS